jgi:hypothetical protein
MAKYLHFLESILYPMLREHRWTILNTPDPRTNKRVIRDFLTGHPDHPRWEAFKCFPRPTGDELTRYRRLGISFIFRGDAQLEENRTRVAYNSDYVVGQLNEVCEEYGLPDKRVFIASNVDMTPDYVIICIRAYVSMDDAKL